MSVNPAPVNGVVHDSAIYTRVLFETTGGLGAVMARELLKRARLESLLDPAGPITTGSGNEIPQIGICERAHHPNRAGLGTYLRISPARQSGHLGISARIRSCDGLFVTLRKRLLATALDNDCTWQFEWGLPVVRRLSPKDPGRVTLTVYAEHLRIGDRIADTQVLGPPSICVRP
jgi:hypothetical protein